METSRCISFLDPFPKVMAGSIRKKQLFYQSSPFSPCSKHIFIRIDSELKHQNFDFVMTNISKEHIADTHFEYVDCINFRETPLKRDLVSIFVVPPRLLFALKEKLRFWNRSVSVVVMCKDEVEVEFQLKGLVMEGVTKLVTCDLPQILHFVNQQIDHCYSGLFEMTRDQLDCKFVCPVSRATSVNLYYPSKFDSFTKVFQSDSTRRRCNYPNLHFYCYDNKKDIVLKDRFKIKTRKTLTKDRIHTGHPIESKLSMSTLLDTQTTMILTTSENEEAMIEYLQDQVCYDVVALGNEEQKRKFLSVFEEMFAGHVPEIQVISCPQLSFFVPYSDTKLLSFIDQINVRSPVRTISYSSLSMLASSADETSSFPHNFALIVSDCESEEMMHMMLATKDLKNVKLLVMDHKDNLARSGSDSASVFRRFDERHHLLEFLKNLSDARAQYFCPIESIKHRSICLLIDKRYIQLCQQLVSTISLYPSTSTNLKIFQSQLQIQSLINSTSSEINYLIICKQQRRTILWQHIQMFSNVRLLVLSELTSINYHPLILDVFRKEQELVEFVGKLCGEREEVERRSVLEYGEEHVAAVGVKYSLESLVIAPVREKEGKPSIIIYSPRQDYSPDWLIFERRLKNLDRRIQIFPYGKVAQISKINLKQEPLSILIVTQINLQWASQFSKEFQTGINIVAYLKQEKAGVTKGMPTNLVVSKLQEVQLVIASAIEYYDQNKLQRITEHEISEGTKLSLESNMKLSMERLASMYSTGINKEYFPGETAVTENTSSPPSKIPPKRKSSRFKISDKDQRVEEEAPMIWSETRERVRTQHPNKSSIEELALHSSLTKSNLNYSSINLKQEYKPQIFILAHESIEQPLVNSNFVRTMVYSSLLQLSEWYTQILEDPHTKVIVKFREEKEHCPLHLHLPPHPRATTIKYCPLPPSSLNRNRSFSWGKKSNRSSIEASQSTDANWRLRNDSVMGVGRGWKERKREKPRQRERIESCKKEGPSVARFCLQMSEEDELELKKTFFSTLSSTEFVVFLTGEQEDIRRAINRTKTSNPRLRTELSEHIHEQQPQQNTIRILVSKDSSKIQRLFTSGCFENLRVVYVGGDNFPSEIWSHRSFLKVSTVCELEAVISYIPRFYRLPPPSAVLQSPSLPPSILDSPSSSPPPARSNNLVSDYSQILNQIDMTALMFKRREILEKMAETMKHSQQNVVADQMDSRVLEEVLAGLPHLVLSTYDTIRSLVSILAQDTTAIVLLNKKVMSRVSKLHLKYPKNVYLSFEGDSEGTQNIYQLSTILDFALLLEASVKFLRRKLISKSRPNKQLCKHLNILLKSPWDLALKQKLEKLSAKVTCICYKSVRSLVELLGHVETEGNYNIVVQRDEDIWELEKLVEPRDWKVVRMYSQTFQEQHFIHSDENVLIEATKDSTVVELVTNILASHFAQGISLAKPKPSHNNPTYRGQKQEGFYPRAPLKSEYFD